MRGRVQAPLDLDQALADAFAQLAGGQPREGHQQHPLERRALGDIARRERRDRVRLAGAGTRLEQGHPGRERAADVELGDGQLGLGGHRLPPPAHARADRPRGSRASRPTRDRSSVARRPPLLAGPGPSSSNRVERDLPAEHELASGSSSSRLNHSPPLRELRLPFARADRSERGPAPDARPHAYAPEVLQNSGKGSRIPRSYQPDQPLDLLAIASASRSVAVVAARSAVSGANLVAAGRGRSSPTRSSRSGCAGARRRPAPPRPPSRCL